MEQEVVADPKAQARLEKHWPRIREYARSVTRSSLAYSIASVGADGCPHLTPVGSLRFHRDFRASYFELFAHGLGQNLDQNPNLCIMGVNSGKWFWLRALMNGEFSQIPAYRFVGRALPRRKATGTEMAGWQKRVRPFRYLRGHKILWAGDRVTHVREIEITDVIPVRLSSMTQHLV